MKEILGLPIGIGSLPHKDATEAVALITASFPNSPYLPELPQRSFKETMGYLQSENFPGLVVNEELATVYIATNSEAVLGYERLYEDYLDNNFNHYAASSEFAAGWQEMFAYFKKGRQPLLLKGQLAGPITYSHILKDEQGQPLYNNELVFDVLKKFLTLKARWLVKKLNNYSQQAVVFLDEPLLQSVGTAMLPIEKDTVVNLLKEVLGEVDGVKGVHCCGNTDWSILTEAGFNIIAFDAFNFTKTLALYPHQLNEFLESGGVLAWGIVPSSNKIKDYKVKDLKELFQQAQTELVKNGVSRRLLKASYLISPSCGLGSLEVDVAAEIMVKTAALANSLL